MFLHWEVYNSHKNFTPITLNLYPNDCCQDSQIIISSVTFLSQIFLCPIKFEITGLDFIRFQCSHLNLWQGWTDCEISVSHFMCKANFCLTFCVDHISVSHFDISFNSTQNTLQEEKKIQIVNVKCNQENIQKPFHE